MLLSLPYDAVQAVRSTFPFGGTRSQPMLLRQTAPITAPADITPLFGSPRNAPSPETARRYPTNPRLRDAARPD